MSHASCTRPSASLASCGLRAAAQDLPDVRGRLDWVARKAGNAAERVLADVEKSKAEGVARHGMEALTRALRAAVACGAADGAAHGLLVSVCEANGRIDALLTDIMPAQDFHDLIGQVTGRVVGLCTELEHSLVRLLLQAAPSDVAARRPAGLEEPQIDDSARAGIVRSQGEVDELLESLGFLTSEARNLSRYGNAAAVAHDSRGSASIAFDSNCITDVHDFPPLGPREARARRSGVPAQEREQRGRRARRVRGHDRRLGLARGTQRPLGARFENLALDLGA